MLSPKALRRYEDDTLRQEGRFKLSNMLTESVEVHQLSIPTAPKYFKYPKNYNPARDMCLFVFSDRVKFTDIDSRLC